MLKIAATSDTHGRPFQVPECDVFIHAGDMTAGGTCEETKEFARRIHDAFTDRRIRRCILVPGNHDKCFQTCLSRVQQMFEYCGFGMSDVKSPVHILIDSGIEIDGYTFWGSPWTPPFMQWSFMKTEDELAEVYKAMPDNLDVLITHGPPYDVLDPGWKEPHAGSKALRTAVASRNIKHHVFGHLHGARGKVSCWSEGDGFKSLKPTLAQNVAAVDEAYNLVNQPVLFQI